MIKVENVKVYNIARAVYSARNAMNSWDKSDSDLDKDVLGENDLNLAKKLIKAGRPHRKFLRQIFVTMDITAPFYIWKQIDTYKVGTVSNSCSTMHKLTSKEFEIYDFSTDGMSLKGRSSIVKIIKTLNELREEYLNVNSEHEEKEFWNDMVKLLPESYNQRRTLTMNYENVINILGQRSNHKLQEWRDFCNELRNLPYIKDFTE